MPRFLRPPCRRVKLSLCGASPGRAMHAAPPRRGDQL